MTRDTIKGLAEDLRRKSPGHPAWKYRKAAKLRLEIRYRLGQFARPDRKAKEI